MSKGRMKRAAIGGLVAAAAIIVGGGLVSAHVTIQEDEIVAGAYSLVTISVPHGCGASPTTEVRIQMPESIPAVTPTVNPNWDVEKVMEVLAEPIQGAHGEITERVSEVVYTAKTPLPDGYRDAFALSLQAPADVSGPLFFPTVQTCEEGETGWIEVPADGQDASELESPAPYVNVVAATDADAGHSDGAAAATDSGDESADATVEATNASTSDSDDGDGNGLAIAALVIGVLGLGTGAVAIARTRTS